MNNGMTQQELAEILGITRQTVLAIEKGKFNPSARLALQIARVFKVSVEEIFFLEESKDE
jgi:putative transcriptional regulator